jgi:hypothetical protein
MRSSRATLASPQRINGGFDIAVIRQADGTTRSLGKPEYDKLPLSDRIRMVLQQQVDFFRDGAKIPPHEAFKLS